MIEDIGSGCESQEALFDIGRVLQECVAKIEETIPMYENERMETKICPYPLIKRDDGSRFLR